MPLQNSEESQWYIEHLLPHEPMLKAWLKSRFDEGIEIEDIVQEACVKVLRARGIRELDAPKAFFFATARNLALNAVRSKAVRGGGANLRIEECDFLDERTDIREEVDRNQELEILTKAIQALPERCRQIFTLRKVYGMPQREIAKKLGLSARTINAQLSIGINRCAEFVENYRGE